MISTLARSAFRGAAKSLSRDLHTGATVAVCGLGSMGHGVVQLCASSGYNVIAMDLDEAQCDHAVKTISNSLTKMSNKAVAKGKMDEATAASTVSDSLSRIRTTTTVADLGEADLIIEAIAEDLPIKLKFFEQLGKVAKADAIIATNTSSFPVGDLAEACGRPSHTIGLHYFNPVQLMKLVEVVCPDGASDDVIATAVAFVEQTNKVAVKCKDTPGFVVNRLLIPYLMQSVAMVARGDATAQAVDTAMRLGAGHPMGPITLCDYVGNDVSLACIKGWVEAHPDDPSFQIPEAVELLEDLVAKNQLGRKTGQGFYEWDGNKPLNN